MVVNLQFFILPHWNYFGKTGYSPFFQVSSSRIQEVVRRDVITLIKETFLSSKYMNDFRVYFSNSRFFMIYKYTAICLMALVVLFVIHLYIIRLNNVDSSTSLQILSQSEFIPAGLYSASDKVVILTANNFDQNVYNSSSAWLVQFYNSYCGHCMRFSTVWKQLGVDIYNWRSVIILAVINCASDENTQHCREYDIMGYPTIRFFKPYTSNFTIPEEYRIISHSDFYILRDHLVSYLESVELTSLPPNWPRLRPIKKTDIDIILRDEHKSEFLLVVENKGSSVGGNLIMDLNSVRWLTVRRILDVEYGRKLSSYEILSLSNNNLSSLVPSKAKNRIDVYQNVRSFLNAKGHSVADLFAKNAVNEVRRPDKMKQTIAQKRLVHTVFQSDLETALCYSLAHEISLKSHILGDCYAALLHYLSVIKKYFPFISSQESSFVHRLLNHLRECTSITGEEFRKLLDQQATDFLLKPKQFMGCSGSSRQYRGYPCGLWMIFHVLTIRRYTKDSAAPGAEVLEAMTDYVKHFFGCRECAQHFLEMSTSIENNVSVASDEVTWLWRAHNNANRRLAGDRTEDPSFPKMQFPHKEICSSCHRIDDTWNEEQVLIFLVNMYTNVQQQTSESVEEAGYIVDDTGNRLRNFSLMNINTCIAVYVLLALLLTIYTVKLFFKRYPPKPFRYDFNSKA